MTVTSARLLGGVLGGSLIGALGFKYNFFVEAGLLAAMVALMVPMRVRYREALTARTSSALRNLRDGMTYVWRENRVILHLILMNFVLVFAFRPVQTLLPAYTGGVLGLEDGAREGGFLLAAQGVGGMIGAFMMASVGYSLKKGQVSLLALVVGVCGHGGIRPVSLVAAVPGDDGGDGPLSDQLHYQQPDAGADDGAG